MAFMEAESGAEKEEFPAWWREAVHELALMAHREQQGQADRQIVTQLLHAVGAKTIALCVSHLWFFGLFNTRLDTMEQVEAPTNIWERVVDGMRLDPQQEFLMGAAASWWKSHERSLQRKREALARQALAAPDDLELQAEVAEETERLLALYKSHLVPVMVLTNTVILRPEQMAEYYVQAWPWLPVLTPIFGVIDERQAANAASGGAPPPAQQPPQLPGGGA